MKTSLRPLNELGALVATAALRIGLARLGDCLPVGRRWGVAYKRSKQERRLAALDSVSQGAKAKTRHEQFTAEHFATEGDEQLLGTHTKE